MIILGIGSVNERRYYYVTTPLIGWTHTQNDAEIIIYKFGESVKSIE